MNIQSMLLIESEVAKKIDQLFWTGIIVLAASMIFSIALVQIVGVGLILLWIGEKIRIKSLTIASTAFSLPLLAFVAARLLSIALSTDRAVSVTALRTEIPFYFLYFVLADKLPISNKRKVIFLLRLMFVCAMLAAMYGTIKVIAGIEPRATSTTSGYVTLGMYLSAVLTLALFLGQNSDFFPYRWMWWVVCTITFVGILSTLNRIHWAAVGLAIPVAGIYRERKFLLAMILLGGAALLASPTLSERFLQLLNFSSQMSGRDVIWKGAWMLIDQHPLFGFGIGTFKEIFPLWDQVPDKGVGSWHNDYLQIYMESGIVGLAALIWLLVRMFSQGVGFVRKASAEPFFRDLVIAILFSLTVCILSAFVGGLFFDPLISLLFLLLLSLLGRAIQIKT